MRAPGDRIDHYVVERPLGRGGEALVFQGAELDTRLRVVLKSS